MPDQETKTDATQTDEGGDDREKSFWEKLTATIDERIDAGVERAIEKHVRKPGTSRNGGQRSTLPSIMADFMFGKPTKED